VVVSQLHRSPGICFEQSSHSSGAVLFSFRIIPDRGSWIEIQFDAQDLLWMYLDRRQRRRKFLITTFLRAIGYGTDEELLGLFYSFEKLSPGRDPGEDQIAGRVFKEDVIDVDSQTVLARRYDPVTPSVLKQMKAAGFNTVDVINVNWDQGIMLKSVRHDPVRSAEDALRDIYVKLRPGDPPTPSNAKQLIKRLFFDARRYDLGRVGRYKINQKLGLEEKVGRDLRVLDKEDVIAAIRYLISIRKGEGMIDDIDQGTDDAVRSLQRDHDSAEAGEPEDAFGGGEGFLRAEPVEPVHGPDQSAFRTGAQAEAERAGAGGTQPGAGRF
jgi:DNA-directed RNA polymerase subunit beta